MVRFRLADGRVVIAERDCVCSNHEGPHWLYENDLRRAANERLRLAGNIRGFITEDLYRIREKRWYMESASIIEIIRE